MTNLWNEIKSMFSADLSQCELANMVLRQRIAELEARCDELEGTFTPVLPDDVAREARYLRLEHCNRAAYMLERLARENKLKSEDILEWMEHDKKQEQRIAELESKCDEYLHIIRHL